MAETINMINQIEANGTYWLQAKYDIDGNEITSEYAKASALDDYLTETDASNTYLTKSNASSTYLKKNDASSTYLTKNDASNTYLTKNSASTSYAPKSEWDTFKKEADFGSGAIDTLAEIQSYIDGDKESAASMLSSLNNKSNIGHTHSVTVAGTVSKPTFTGTQATITSSYKPAGTVSQPTFTGTSVTSNAASTTNTHTTSVLTGVTAQGVLPTLDYTAPSCEHTAATFTPSVNNGVLSFAFTGGGITFDAGSATFTQGSMPTFGTGTASTAKHTHSVTAAGTVSKPTFTGSDGSATASYTPAGSVSQPTFEGTAVTTNGDVKPTA